MTEPDDRVLRIHASVGSDWKPTKEEVIRLYTTLKNVSATVQKQRIDFIEWYMQLKDLCKSSDLLEVLDEYPDDALMHWYNEGSSPLLIKNRLS